MPAINQKVIPSKQSKDLVTFTVKVEGTALPKTISVLSIEVVKEINKIPYAKLVIADGSASDQDFKISNQDYFVPGKKVEITAGYHSDEKTIFKGLIIKHQIRISGKNQSSLVVECKDEAVRLTLGRKNKYFYNQTDTDIIDSILNNYDTLDQDVQAGATNPEHEKMVQYYCSDWDFIVSRAEANGLLVFTDDGKITIKAPDLGGSSSGLGSLASSAASALGVGNELELQYGSTIFELEAEMDARNQYHNIKANAWDPTQQELSDEESGDPGFTEEGNISGDTLADILNSDDWQLQHSGNLQNDELQNWSDAQMMKSRLAKIRGRVKFQGYADVKPGDQLSLKGVGKRFNGKAFVSTVAHDIVNGHWFTVANLGMSPQWFSASYDDIMDTPSSGLLPAVSGLQIGIVTDLEDPENEFRVRLRLPLIDNEEDGIWARIATLDAGDNRGTFFRPEIGDEVIVGFINEDPREAIILGMLNSSAKPAPLKPSNDNDQKGYVSRSELKWIFDDDKNSVTIITPDKNQIVISDDDGSILIKDKNDNSIKLNQDGITLQSNKDIILKATGDIKLQGSNIQMTAQQNFKASSNVGTEVSSSGNTNIKGLMVNIN